MSTRIDKVFPLIAFSFAHINIRRKQYKTKHFYCIQNTSLCLFFSLSCDFFSSRFWLRYSILLCFVHIVVIIVDMFVCCCCFFPLFSDINPHLNTYGNAFHQIFPRCLCYIVAYFACAALLFGNFTPIKRNISFEWI